MGFRVIKGGLEEKAENKKLIKQKREEKYRELYYENLYSPDADRKRTVFYGVKYACLHTIDTTSSYRDMLQFMMEMNNIAEEMGFLTYRELMNIFPIIKDFDGWRYESKDYWSTMDYLQKKDLDRAVGDNVEDFLWTYYNLDIINFGIKRTLITDKLLRAGGNEGILEGFLNIIDPKHTIHTYHVHKEEGYVYDNHTGKTFKISEPKKRVPKQFTVV